MQIVFIYVKITNKLNAFRHKWIQENVLTHPAPMCMTGGGSPPCVPYAWR